MIGIKTPLKYTCLLIFLILIVALTLYSIFDENSLTSIVASIKTIQLYYVFIALGIIALYFILQGIYMKIMLKTFKKDIPLKKGVFYSLVEFYFSGITPSSTGGQPVQLYYMTKDKIPVRNSYIILILNTIYFKVILIILGIAALLFKSSYIFENNFVYIFFFGLGFLTDLVMVTLCLAFLLDKKLIKKVLTKLFALSKRFKLFRKKTENKNIDEMIARYNDELQFIKNNKKIIAITFIITFMQRLSMFSIAFVVYKALGLSGYTYFDLLAIQVSVQLAIEMLPIPGGAVLSEGMFYSMFALIFASQYSDVAMLLTRTFSFYTPLLVSGVIILLYTIISKKRRMQKISKI